MIVVFFASTLALLDKAAWPTFPFTGGCAVTYFEYLIRKLIKFTLSKGILLMGEPCMENACLPISNILIFAAFRLKKH